MPSGTFFRPGPGQSTSENRQPMAPKASNPCSSCRGFPIAAGNPAHGHCPIPPDIAQALRMPLNVTGPPDIDGHLRMIRTPSDSIGLHRTPSDASGCRRLLPIAVNCRRMQCFRSDKRRRRVRSDDRQTFDAPDMPGPGPAPDLRKYSLSIHPVAMHPFPVRPEYQDTDNLPKYKRLSQERFLRQ